jgi:hypothetical protein
MFMKETLLKRQRSRCILRMTQTLSSAYNVAWSHFVVGWSCDALEIELEQYIADFRVWTRRRSDVKPTRGSETHPLVATATEAPIPFGLGSFHTGTNWVTICCRRVSAFKPAFPNITRNHEGTAVGSESPSL